MEFFILGTFIPCCPSFDVFYLCSWFCCPSNSPMRKNSPSLLFPVLCSPCAMSHKVQYTLVPCCFSCPSLFFNFLCCGQLQLLPTSLPHGSSQPLHILQSIVYISKVLIMFLSFHCFQNKIQNLLYLKFLTIYS